jgi:hypothetical protein
MPLNAATAKGKLRWLMTALLLVVVSVASGPFIWSGGYGGLILWLGCIVICPVVVASVSPRFAILFGLISNALIELSLAWTRYQWMAQHSEDPVAWFWRNPGISIGTFVFSIGVGTLVGVSVHRIRREENLLEMKTRVAEILNDPRFADSDANKEELIAEYGSDHVPEAIYLLSDQYGWQRLYDVLVEILRNDNKREHWETAQIVLFYAAGDQKRGIRQCPMPADFTIALLYHRFSDGIDDGDRIWAIVCDLKHRDHWSDYDPMQDAGVLTELESISSA